LVNFNATCICICISDSHQKKKNNLNSTKPPPRGRQPVAAGKKGGKKGNTGRGKGENFQRGTV
jgi:hypothetical protein